jgi:hypothetical protein
MKRLLLAVALLASAPLSTQQTTLTVDDIPEILRAVDEMNIEIFCKEFKKRYLETGNIYEAFEDTIDAGF